MKESFTIHDLPPTERPRERLLKFGPEALSSQEILALILGRGSKGESVLVTSQNLLATFGNLKNIANASIAELSKIKGIGPAKAAQIKAAFELGKRLEYPPDQSVKEKVKRPEDAIKAVKNKLKGKKKEHFLILCLDTRNQPIDTQTVSIGSLGILLHRVAVELAISQYRPPDTCPCSGKQSGSPLAGHRPASVGL